MSLVAVATHCRHRGFDGVRTEVRDAYEVVELREALLRHYDTDAHLVGYVVDGATRQPRINKPGLLHFGHPVRMGVFFCDVDNPDHGYWDEESFAAAMAQYESLEVLQTAGVYHTARGRRIVQPISEPTLVQHVEPYIRRWFLLLEQAGLAVDWACRDWTRHYRLPNVRRGGARYRSPWIDLAWMQPMSLGDLPGEPAPEPAPSKAPRSQAGAPPRLPRWSGELPAHWRERAQPIADAVREVQTEWHTLFMAIAGALLSRGAPPEYVPLLCREISERTGTDSRTEDRIAAARTTVQRRLSGQPTTGYAQLLRRWPSVGMAMDSWSSTGPQARARALSEAKAPEPELSLAETTAALEQAIRDAPMGVSLIAAECGLGKTQAAIRIAAERARRAHSSPGAAGIRAPPQSKTAISVDKHALAIQIRNDPQLAGLGVKRIFGPLSVKRPDGTPGCLFHEAAGHLVAGGQSMQRELCEGRGRFRCEYYEGCAARVGYEGPDDARITIGPHALIGALDKAAGATGLLVVDEPPGLLETKVLSLADVELAERRLMAFERAYADAMLPVLLAVQAWLRHPGGGGRGRLVEDGLRQFAEDVPTDVLERAQAAAEVEGDVVECAAHAPLLDARNKSPPLRQLEVLALRRSPRQAAKIGSASRVLSTLYQAVISKTPVVGRVDEVQGQRVLKLTAARHDLVRALRRGRATVVMDAGIAVHAPVYERALGYAPPLHAFRARDGASIERTHLWCRSASRRHWMRAGKLLAKPSLVNAVRQIVRWANRDPDTEVLGIITLRPIRLALEAVLRPEDSAVHAAWEEAGQLLDTLSVLRAALGGILAEWDGEVVLGHYGAIRGLDSMAEVDCLVTLGDPWPDVGQVAHDLEYLGMVEAADARMEALCRAELEQAHGRMRVVHRTRPGRALHVGRVLPGGSGWADGQVSLEQIPGGRPPRVSAMTRKELEHAIQVIGGVSDAARAATCSRSYLQKCRAGERAVSDEVAWRLRAQLPPPTSASSEVPVAAGGTPPK